MLRTGLLALGVALAIVAGALEAAYRSVVDGRLTGPARFWL